MNYTVQHHRNETADRRKSGIITAVISVLIFLLIYYYQFTKTTAKESQAVTTMLINFGDNRNGDGLEEPANEEGSVAASEVISLQEPATEVKVESSPPVVERVFTGNNTKITAPKPVEKSKKISTAPPKIANKSRQPANAAAKSTVANKQGDGRGTAAIGNLVRGRGTAPGSQGQNGTTGNAGDPLGGDGDGDSKIGIDRKLTGFIPGTMGRGGAQPSNSCSASGTVHIFFSVDKAGNVISARRSGGISDPCVVSTSVAWVKQYVKAERANTVSTGSYKITF